MLNCTVQQWSEPVKKIRTCTSTKKKVTHLAYYKKNTNKYNSEEKMFFVFFIILSLTLCVTFVPDTQARGCTKQWKLHRKIRFSIKSTCGTFWSSMKLSPTLTNYCVPQQFM